MIVSTGWETHGGILTQRRIQIQLLPERKMIVHQSLRTINFKTPNRKIYPTYRIHFSLPIKLLAKGRTLHKASLLEVLVLLQFYPEMQLPSSTPANGEDPLMILSVLP